MSRDDQFHTGEFKDSGRGKPSEPERSIDAGQTYDTDAPSMVPEDDYLYRCTGRDTAYWVDRTNKLTKHFTVSVVEKSSQDVILSKTDTSSVHAALSREAMSYVPDGVLDGNMWGTAVMSVILTAWLSSARGAGIDGQKRAPPVQALALDNLWNWHVALYKAAYYAHPHVAEEIERTGQ